jgi:uncharacterized protein
MKLHRDSATGNAIRRYEPGAITVGETTFQTSLLLNAEDLLEEWGVGSIEELAAPHIERLADLDPEIVLLGTGERQHFPPARLLAQIYAQGIGIEIMDTYAACRTFNILAGEGRRVLAALIVEHD